MRIFVATGAIILFFHGSRHTLGESESIVGFCISLERFKGSFMFLNSFNSGIICVNITRDWFIE